MAPAATDSRSNRAHDFGRGRPLGQEHLDRDALANVHVLGEVDDPHAPFAEDRFDAVPFGDDRSRLDLVRLRDEWLALRGHRDRIADGARPTHAAAPTELSLVRPET